MGRVAKSIALDKPTYQIIASYEAWNLLKSFPSCCGCWWFEYYLIANSVQLDMDSGWAWLNGALGCTRHKMQLYFYYLKYFIRYHSIKIIPILLDTLRVHIWTQHARDLMNWENKSHIKESIYSSATWPQYHRCQIRVLYGNHTYIPSMTTWPHSLHYIQHCRQITLSQVRR